MAAVDSSQGELVVSGAVGEVGDGGPVRGENRVPLPDAGGAGQVLRLAALLLGDDEDVPSGLEEGAFTLPEGGEGVDELLGVDGSGRQLPPVGRNVHGDLPVGVGGGLHDVEGSCLEEDDPLAVGGGHLDVEPRELGDLLRRLGGGIQGVEVGDSLFLPVREEVDGLSDPHGVGVLADVVGQGGELLGREVVEEDVLVPPPLVPLPIVLLDPLGAVGHLRAVAGD